MITVTGATGNVGQPLINALIERGYEVGAVSRGESAPLPTRPGIRPVLADLADPATLAPALERARALYVLVSGAGGHVDGPQLMAIARDAGVERVVLQSSQAVATRPDSVSHRPMAALEQAVRDSGMAWTILRPGGFHSNAAAWIPSVAGERTVYAPYGDVALPAVDPHDIADVAAAALTEPGHAGATYVLTGPEAISPRTRAEAIGRVIGEPVSFVELTHRQAREAMLEFMPEPVADGTLAILGEPTADERTVSPDVEKLLARPGRSFDDWVHRHVKLFT